MANLEARTRADGGVSYRVRWRLGGTRDGAQQTETFSAKVRAEAFKLDVEEAGHRWPKGWIKGEGYRQRRPDVKTLGDVAAAYFEEQAHRVQMGNVKAYTLHRYRRTYELHLAPALADESFAEIGRPAIRGWVTRLQAEGKAAKSIKNYHGLLYSIMAHGQDQMGLRPDNPCTRTDLPEDDVREARQLMFFQHAEWQVMRSCLKSDVHLLVDVLLATGIRWGEASALRVDDVTFENGNAVLHIRRAWSKRAPDDTSPIFAEAKENGSWKLGPPKNRNARYVVVGGALVADLAQRVREVADQGVGQAAYLFQTRHGNPWRHADFHADRWLPAVGRAAALGMDKHVTPHMLRHTAVVWSLAEGVPIQTVSYRLGHASIQITFDRYGGLIDLSDPEMANAMARSVLKASTADVPTVDQAEVDAAKVRPGRRGESRAYAGRRLS